MDLPIVGEVRGKGFMVCVEFVVNTLRESVEAMLVSLEQEGRCAP